MAKIGNKTRDLILSFYSVLEYLIMHIRSPVKKDEILTGHIYLGKIVFVLSTLIPNVFVFEMELSHLCLLV